VHHILEHTYIFLLSKYTCNFMKGGLVPLCRHKKACETCPLLFTSLSVGLVSSMHLYCSCHGHRYSGFIHVRYWRRFLMKSVIVIIAVSFHLQQYDNFCKYSKKMLSGVELSFMFALLCLVYHWGSPYRCVLHCN
jgi:hypothetical protein